MRNRRRVVMLVGLWLLAWGQFSLANILSGIAVAVGLLAAFPAIRAGRHHVHPSPAGIARLGLYVLRQLLISNVAVGREILRRRVSLAPGVIAYRLGRPTDEVITIMTSIISLSPGTMTADIDPDGTTLHVHFLLLRDVDAARAGLARLEQLVVTAVGPGRAVPSRPEASP